MFEFYAHSGVHQGERMPVNTAAKRVHQGERMPVNTAAKPVHKGERIAVNTAVKLRIQSLQWGKHLEIFYKRNPNFIFSKFWNFIFRILSCYSTTGKYLSVIFRKIIFQFPPPKFGFFRILSCYSTTGKYLSEIFSKKKS